MKAIVIGTGTVGSAVKKALEEKGHEVVSIGRKSGDYQADISDPSSLMRLATWLGPLRRFVLAHPGTLMVKRMFRSAGA
jgi:nucleoside-diphosphate-sugar epimerase